MTMENKFCARCGCDYAETIKSFKYDGHPCACTFEYVMRRDELTAPLPPKEAPTPIIYHIPNQDFYNDRGEVIGPAPVMSPEEFWLTLINCYNGGRVLDASKIYSLTQQRDAALRQSWEGETK